MNRCINQVPEFMTECHYDPVTDVEEVGGQGVPGRFLRRVAPPCSLTSYELDSPTLLILR